MSTTSPAATTDFLSSRQLNDAERSILSELFASMPNAESGVDSVRFKPRHREHLELVQQLVNEQLIREDQERYFLTLPALALMDTTESRMFLARAERIFVALESAYIADPRTPVLVSALAISSGITEADARNALSYMAKATSWLAIQPRDVLNNMDATVGASDVVIKKPNFWAAMNELESWRCKGPFPMTQEDWQAAVSGQALSLSSTNTSLSGSSVRAVPTWLHKLPKPIELVMTEVHTAVEGGMQVLPAIGVRTALDMYFSDVLGSDSGTFAGKVKQLEAIGHLSSQDASNILVVIDGGNASAHRGYMPDAEDLQTILAFGDRLLRAHYDLPAAAKRLQGNVPARNQQPPKQAGTP